MQVQGMHASPSVLSAVELTHTQMLEVVHEDAEAALAAAPADVEEMKPILFLTPWIVRHCSSKRMDYAKKIFELLQAVAKLRSAIDAVRSSFGSSALSASATLFCTTCCSSFITSNSG